MNRQATFQMPKQNFKVLVETHRDGAENIMYDFPAYRICSLIIFLALSHLYSMQQAKKWNILINEFLASCWVSLLPWLVSFSTSVVLSLKRMNALPTHSAADVILFPGIEHQQQIRCTLTSVQSHAVITSSSFSCALEQGFQINHLLDCATVSTETRNFAVQFFHCS